ncbi:glycosyltransferase family 2 protein [Oryzomicrobium terrae]|uniref:glycosyltransferase family 2 protein n=1 Tax=Oryzomicrobium terrae TaxID=1735038 RepID=UPI001659D698|nr:glycosyltransferase family 2 protein [Oryzomicrobium terrae]
MTTQPAPKISIALCTYNGKDHVEAFLKSLIEQKRQPDELIICDDNSTDTTPDLIRHFASISSFPIRTYFHANRLGVQQNFDFAIRHCQGQIIMLADQDDYWQPSKIELLETTFLEKQAVAVFSDAEVVDKELRPLGYGMWETCNFRASEQAALLQNNDGTECLLRHYIVTGATLAFKRSLVDVISPIPKNWPHDAWIALLATGYGPITFRKEKLILYRQHGNNIVGGLKKSLWKDIKKGLHIKRTDIYSEEIDRLQKLITRARDKRLKPSFIFHAEEKLKFYIRRKALPSNRLSRLAPIFRDFHGGYYKRFTRNIGSLFIDLLQP